MERALEPKLVIINLLKSCDLPTDHIENINTVQKSSTQSVAAAYGSSTVPFGDIQYGSEFSNFEFTFHEKSVNDRKELR